MFGKNDEHYLKSSFLEAFLLFSISFQDRGEGAAGCFSNVFLCRCHFLLTGSFLAELVDQKMFFSLHHKHYRLNLRTRELSSVMFWVTRDTLLLHTFK